MRGTVFVLKFEQMFLLFRFLLYGLTFLGSICYTVFEYFVLRYTILHVYSSFVLFRWNRWQESMIHAFFSRANKSEIYLNAGHPNIRESFFLYMCLRNDTQVYRNTDHEKPTASEYVTSLLMFCLFCLCRLGIFIG